VRVLLASALRRGDAAASEQAMHEAVAAVEREISSLRARIENLRPAMLDQLGLPWAMERVRERLGADGLDAGGDDPRSVADQVAF
jgi:signal transduction histidine kinase